MRQAEPVGDRPGYAELRACRHGETDSHGIIGDDWCPGSLPLRLEPWRRQLEFQMNSTPFGGVPDGE